MSSLLLLVPKCWYRCTVCRTGSDVLHCNASWCCAHLFSWIFSSRSTDVGLGVSSSLNIEVSSKPSGGDFTEKPFRCTWLFKRPGQLSDPGCVPSETERAEGQQVDCPPLSLTCCLREEASFRWRMCLPMVWLDTDGVFPSLLHIKAGASISLQYPPVNGSAQHLMVSDQRFQGKIVDCISAHCKENGSWRIMWRCCHLMSLK